MKKIAFAVLIVLVLLAAGVGQAYAAPSYGPPTPCPTGTEKQGNTCVATATPPTPTNGTIDWDGNGSTTCPSGCHWVLPPGNVTGATLIIEVNGVQVESVPLSQNGNDGSWAGDSTTAFDPTTPGLHVYVEATCTGTCDDKLHVQLSHANECTEDCEEPTEVSTETVTPSTTSIVCTLPAENVNGVCVIPTTVTPSGTPVVCNPPAIEVNGVCVNPTTPVVTQPTDPGDPGDPGEKEKCQSGKWEKEPDGTENCKPVIVDPNWNLCPELGVSVGCVAHWGRAGVSDVFYWGISGSVGSNPK